MRKIYPELPCSWCGQAMQPTSEQMTRVRKRGQIYCSKKCSKASFSHQSSVRMAQTNRKYASARMKANNPMSRPEVRELVSQKLREMGHKPPVQGGNGRGLSESQRMLSEALGWPTEVVVPTKALRNSGLPSHYKIDIANLEMKIAIEVDGSSHQALKVRERDQRKQEFLAGVGWIVLRFWNREVMADLEGCVQVVLSTTSKSKATTPTSRTA